MEYRLLGPLEVLNEGRAMELGGAKQRALLAVLLLHANQVVSVDRLMQDIWDDEPPDTAANVIQTYVSRLRKILNSPGRHEVLATKAPGYVIRTEPGQLDLERFRALVREAGGYRERGDSGRAAASLEAALDLWRGEPLADFTYHSFAQSHIERLREEKAAAIEERIQAELDHGGGEELVGELQALVAEHPLRERLRALLMISLYRAGRQAEALAAFQDARAALVEELGIDPGPELQRLERAILSQDQSLLPETGDATRASNSEGVAPPTPEPTEPCILVVPRDPTKLDLIVQVARPLAASAPGSELILSRLLGPWETMETSSDDLSNAVRELNLHRSRLEEEGIVVRLAAFTSKDPARDLARLAVDHRLELAIIDGWPEMFEEDQDALADVLEAVACDVALVFAKEEAKTSFEGGRVVVPFGGAEHDWAALHVAARLAAGSHASLHLLGATEDVTLGRRDASRLLASASLIVQRMTGVVAEPILVEPGESVLDAALDATLVVSGLSERWREEGLGELRSRLIRSIPAPYVALRRGTSSGASTPADFSRHTWSTVRGRS